ncbi:hypothetical protein [Tenebrionicola larvae]|jgi:hypothetical protein|uniref:Uncharacterized protein n=1 Tax=Tenebrionicola larvae TaxID=2815733 RepID=A0A949Q1M2_9ENTR|nr:hypothetical protein [Tenebrionicola larvae]MBV5094926.1 hypothetical protein [Tenebrionicola larvae]
MVKSLSVMGITDSDFPMSSITGRANLLLTTSTGGGVQMGIKNKENQRIDFRLLTTKKEKSRFSFFVNKLNRLPGFLFTATFTAPARQLRPTAR